MKRKPSPSAEAMSAVKRAKLEPGRAASASDISDAADSSKQRTTTAPSRGLRHFSMKVCEKVEEKGTTTYNEVADELVKEIKAADEKAALERGEPAPVKPIEKKNNDDKNIRRRVYDALNVLMAMDIITKDKKEITWRGLPGTHDSLDVGPGAMNMISGLSRSQRMQKLEEERLARQEQVKRKKAHLEELMTQHVSFHNLLGRNHAMEMRERHSNFAARPPVEKIPLPLIVVNTSSRALVQCEMTPDRKNVNFDFSLPFNLVDDNNILKRMGMNRTSSEALQHSLPPELFQYCDDNGIIDSIVQR